MSRDTLASLRDRCNKLGKALDEAREEIAGLKRSAESAPDEEGREMTAAEEVAYDIRYGDLRELVAQLRTALPAVDLERLRKALDEP